MESFVAQKRVLLAVTADISLFSVKLSLPSANIWMKTFFDSQLPNNYLENSAKYQEILTKFGTHFFQTATFGGFSRVSSKPTRDYALKHTTEELKTQINIFFMNQTGQGEQIPEKTFLDSHGISFCGGNVIFPLQKSNFSS
jgi:hypothetical protein